MGKPVSELQQAIDKYNASLSAAPLQSEGEDDWKPLPAVPSIAKGTKWCQPGQAGRERHFVVRFEDQDRGDAVFTDEAEAREYWARATTNWNCWLFGAMPVDAAPPPAAQPVMPDLVDLCKDGSPLVIDLISDVDRAVKQAAENCGRYDTVIHHILAKHLLHRSALAASPAAPSVGPAETSAAKLAREMREGTARFVSAPLPSKEA